MSHLLKTTGWPLTIFFFAYSVFILVVIGLVTFSLIERRIRLRRLYDLQKKQNAEPAENPPWGPAKYEAIRQELLDDGFQEVWPGTFMKPVLPDYRSEEKAVAKPATATRDNPAFKGLMEALKTRSEN